MLIVVWFGYINQQAVKSLLNAVSRLPIIEHSPSLAQVIACGKAGLESVLCICRKHLQEHCIHIEIEKMRRKLKILHAVVGTCTEF